MIDPVIPPAAAKALTLGNLREAFEITRHYYAISGTVETGERLGRTIGFPTANLKTEDNETLPIANGVYAANIIWRDKTFNGMVNIGVRPTVGASKRMIEAHLFDFSDNLYDEKITIIFRERIRDEQKFPSLEALKKQLVLDRKKAEEILITGDKPDANPV